MKAFGPFSPPKTTRKVSLGQIALNTNGGMFLDTDIFYKCRKMELIIHIEEEETIALWSFKEALSC